jgi:hypothetical protein
MGQGEYGGNGSVHYYGVHKRDRNHGHSPHSYHEVDEYPSSPGSEFTVEVLNLPPGKTYTVAANGVLTLTTPIKIDPQNPNKYTPSIYITWPDPPSVAPGASGSSSAPAGTTRSESA